MSRVAARKKPTKVVQSKREIKERYVRYKVVVTRVQVAERFVRAPGEEEAAAASSRRPVAAQSTARLLRSAMCRDQTATTRKGVEGATAIENRARGDVISDQTQTTAFRLSASIQGWSVGGEFALRETSTTGTVYRIITASHIAPVGPTWRFSKLRNLTTRRKDLMTYAVTVVAEEKDLELLQQAAVDVDGVTLSEPESLNTSGDGLNFPIDPDTMIESMKVIAAVVSTVNGLRQLLAAWSARRSKRRMPDSEIEGTIVIAEVHSGRTLYTGSQLNEEIAADVAATVEGERPAV
jgi:hypothetical protein